MTTISDDEFMTNLTSLIDRPLTALSEDHFYFLGPDPQIMMHVWYENGFYFGGISERNYRPGGRIRANDLTTVKQALHNWGCSWGLNPPVSRSARVM